ncbi:MAG: glycosyltransferase [Planctomycetota bacterium]
MLIPTRGRASQLHRLLTSLESQTLADPRFEVLVGVDGGEAPLSHGRFGIAAFEHRGPAATRNALVEGARGRYVLFLNDDVVASPDLVETHLREQESLAARGTPAMVLGSAPWHVHGDDRVFDRLIRETSMVFFYDRMDPADTERDWGFRHAWTLNLSVPTAVVREHRFNESLDRAMFEDLEWAWRVQRASDVPVLYRPSARVVHDHRYEPRDYLSRERELGRQAVRLAALNPACAAEVFGRDLTDPGFADSCRAQIERDASSVEPLIESFRALADVPASAVGDRRLIRALYEHHLPLKRHLWRHGVIEACWTRAAA